MSQPLGRLIHGRDVAVDDIEISSMASQTLTSMFDVEEEKRLRRRWQCHALWRLARWDGNELRCNCGRSASSVRSGKLRAESGTQRKTSVAALEQFS
jgi:hypothetical protein